MNNLFRRHTDDDGSSLTFDCDTPVDGAITAAGGEPTGYFWDGVLAFVAPELAEGLEFDSEGSMFCAYGAVDDLDEAQRVLKLYMTDTDKVLALMERAESAGVTLGEPFDDEDDDQRPGFLARLLKRG
ncbi:Imm51 family immunity protein [Aeromicrobium wangtongii]|uniref:Immunity 51 family protein n=1 Tax=Aeromicrobium wangtongii TaxID=2969247 RepID=A0ABY5MBS7_9ACTN|nr:Imm51 family immunity protein [Aeromicrobium wangtongii]MCD9197795.1 immunity 51 family protein [Aeromicrobium wangtongii]UUP15277.1 immunity 51 family protein [Aeromicrobium wangtongii]